MTFTLLDIFALASIVFIGLPHGAFDGGIAYLLGWNQRRFGMAIFTGLYVLLAISVIAIWIVAPTISLVFFLGISLVHFGLGDNHFVSLPSGYQYRFFKLLKYLSVFCHGGIVTIALPFFHPEEVSQIFVILSGEPAMFLTGILHTLFPVWLAAVVFYLALSAHLRSLRGFTFEIIMLTSVIASLPPAGRLCPLFLRDPHCKAYDFSVSFCCRHAEQKTSHKTWGVLFNFIMGRWLCGVCYAFGFWQSSSHRS